MKKLKYVQLFEKFGKLNESVDENWVVKPYEFKTPEDWEKEFNPQAYDSCKLNSNTKPPQYEVYNFEHYIDKMVDESSSYGSEYTFRDIIRDLLTRSFEEMFKVKEPNQGYYFWQDEFFLGMYDKDWHKNEEKIQEVVASFMSVDFSSDSKFERDERPEYRDEYGSGTHKGTVYFKGKEVFSWSSEGDGYNFSGSMKNGEMLYKEIKDYLTMVLYM